jgi:hypothetical protein
MFNFIQGQKVRLTRPKESVFRRVAAGAKTGKLSPLRGRRDAITTG